MSNVARGTLLGIAGQAWNLLTAFFLYAFLLRVLGPALFGEWRVVISVLTWFEIFVASGLADATSKAVSESPGELPQLRRAAAIAETITAAGVFVLLLVFAGPIATALSNPSLTPWIRIAAVDIPLYGAFMLTSALVLGMKRYERQALSWSVYATGKAVLIGSLVAAGLSVPGALIGNALASVVGFLALATAWRGRSTVPSELRPVIKRIFVAAVPFLTLSLIGGIGENVDLWSVSSLVDDRVLVGLYATAASIAEVPLFLFFGLTRVLLPAVASANSGGDTALAGRYTTQAMRLALIVTVLGVAVVLANGRQVLQLIGGKGVYVGAFVPLSLLMTAALGRTLHATSSAVLMAQNRRRASVGLLAGKVVAEVVLLIALTPVFGIEGAAAATAISAIASAAWAVWLLRHAVGPRPIATLVRCVVAGAIVAVVLALVAPPPVALFIAFPLAGIAYLGLLALLREFTAEDYGSIRNAIAWRARGA